MRDRNQGSRFAGLHQRLFYLYGCAYFQHRLALSHAAYRVVLCVHWHFKSAGA